MLINRVDVHGAWPRGRSDLHRGAVPVSAAWVRNKGQ